MEEKETKRIRLSTLFLVLAIIALVPMGYFTYKTYNEKLAEEKKSSELQDQINSLNSTINELQQQVTEKESADAQTKQQGAEGVYDENITYEITENGEATATIKATKDNQTVTRKIETEAAIADTGTMVIPGIGSVALVADSGGEYYGVSVYKLSEGKIKRLGTIGCGAEMVEDATYEITTKAGNTAVVTATRKGKKTTNEFTLESEIVKTDVIDILDRGKVALVSTNTKCYMYTIIQDPTNGETGGIYEAGTLEKNP